MARRRFGSGFGGVRGDLIARRVEDGEVYAEVLGRDPFAGLVDSLRSGRAVDMHGFELARYFPGSGLAGVNRVRLEVDDSVTVDPVEDRQAKETSP